MTEHSTTHAKFIRSAVWSGLMLAFALVAGAMGIKIFVSACMIASLYFAWRAWRSLHEEVKEREEFDRIIDRYND